MMYGVVLLMAVTAGSESADLGRRSTGCGCSGYVASCGGCGGCATAGCRAPRAARGGRGCAGCSGCGGYVVVSCRGCAAPTCGGYAPVRPACMGVISYPSCGGSVMPGCGGSVMPGCGGMVMPGCGGTMPGCGGTMPGCGGTMPGGGGEKKKMVSAPADAATMVVSLPAEAKLTIDGAATTSISSERVFQSPELVPGKIYSYTLVASYTKEGKAVSVSKKVTVEAGKVTEVDLNKESPVEVAAASKDESEVARK